MNRQTGQAGAAEKRGNRGTETRKKLTVALLGECKNIPLVARLETHATQTHSAHGLIRLSISQVAKRSNGLSSKGFLKIVEAPPKLLEAREHGKIVLTCSASGNPAPEITWFKNGAPLVKKARTISSVGQLTQLIMSTFRGHTCGLNLRLIIHLSP